MACKIGHVSYHKLKLIMQKSMLKGLPQHRRNSTTDESPTRFKHQRNSTTDDGGAN